MPAPQAAGRMRRIYPKETSMHKPHQKHPAQAPKHVPKIRNSAALKWAAFRENGSNARRLSCPKS